MAALGTILSTAEVNGGTVQYTTPVTTNSITINDATDVLLVNPAGTIAALTIVFPATPATGKVIKIASSQIVTTLTITSAKTVVGGLAALTVGGFAQYIYNSTADLWFRIG